MASGWYQNGLKNCLNGTIDIDTTTLKLMFVKTTYTFDPDHLVIDDGTTNATCAKAKECSMTNYTPGWGSASRATATITLQANTTNNKVEVALADWVIAALGGASNDTIGGVILLKEGGANDTTSIPIAYWDLSAAGPGGAALTTNGSPVTIDFAALGSGGNLTIAC